MGYNSIRRINNKTSTKKRRQTKNYRRANLDLGSSVDKKVKSDAIEKILRQEFVKEVEEANKSCLKK